MDGHDETGCCNELRKEFTLHYFTLLCFLEKDNLLYLKGCRWLQTLSFKPIKQRNVANLRVKVGYSSLIDCFLLICRSMELFVLKATFMTPLITFIHPIDASLTCDANKIKDSSSQAENFIHQIHPKNSKMC